MWVPLLGSLKHPRVEVAFVGASFFSSLGGAEGHSRSTHGLRGIKWSAEWKTMQDIHTAEKASIEQP